MADTVNRRNYESPRRTAAAAETRARLRAAAARLFTEQGYAATTVKQVARAAGVGERTLYDAFPTKAALFGHTLGVAVVGDVEPMPVADRDWVRAAEDEPDPVAALALLADNATALLERAGDLIMVSIEAAASDPDMRAATEAGARATRDIQLRVAEALDRRGALRDGLDPGTAADVLALLVSPPTHQFLRRRSGWDIGKYRDWLHTAMIRELLPPRTCQEISSSRRNSSNS